MKTWAKQFYHTAAWLSVRDNVLRRDMMLCQDCLKAGRYTPAREVHHIIELTAENVKDPSVSLNPDNLVSLCHGCHQSRHRPGQEERRYTVDKFGRVEVKK